MSTRLNPFVPTEGRRQRREIGLKPAVAVQAAYQVDDAERLRER